MKVFVTGGAGYIGSHVVWALLEAGHQVSVYDNLQSGHADAIDPRVSEFFERGIRCRDDIEHALRESQPDAVIHLAGLISVADSVERPMPYWETNLEGTLNLLSELQQWNDTIPIVFSSTAAVYGDDPSRLIRRGQVPFSEHEIVRPVSPYGATKLAAEEAIRHYGAAYAIPWIVLRYFNAAGGNVAAQLRERHEPETHLIPTLLDVAAGRRASFPLRGVNYQTPDGTAIRDYVHVMDIADAHVRAVERLVMQRTEGSGAFNLGTGKGSSVREVVAMVEAVTGKTIVVEELQRRVGDPPYLVADPGKAAVFLDWAPKRTLQQIVEDAWTLHPKEEDDDA